MKEQDSFPSEAEDFASFGEQPPEVDVPGVIGFDSNSRLERLPELAKRFATSHESIITHARKTGKEIVLYISGFGTNALIGAGIAVSAAVVGGIVIYRHRHEGQPQEENSSDITTKTNEK